MRRGRHRYLTPMKLNLTGPKSESLHVEVSEEDFERVAALNPKPGWRIGTRYIQALMPRTPETLCDRKTLSLHAFILPPGPGLVVDHIDGDNFNNTRANLRVLTPQQNKSHRNPRPSAGVWFSPTNETWIAEARIYAAGPKGRGGVSTFLGAFKTQLDAETYRRYFMSGTWRPTWMRRA